MAAEITPAPDPVPTVAEKVEGIEGHLLNFPQTECPLVHRFAPGVYLREIHMPAGTFVIGHSHNTEHFNVITEGRALVMMDGVTEEVVAPAVFASGVGVRKVLYIQEDMTWITVHPTDETDLQKLEALLITKSETYLKHLEDLNQLKQIVHEVTP
jgi:hypothetical protein